MKATYTQPSLSQRLYTFFSMVKKELIVMSRYPVNFVASFFQIFIIVAVFTFAGLAFSPGGISGGGDQEISGIVVYGFIMFIFLSDTMWTMGGNLRQEQVQGTLEQLFLSPASRMANLISRVTNILTWTFLLVVAAAFFMSLLLGGNLPAQNIPLALYVLFMSILGIFGVGFAFASLALTLKDTAQTLTNLLQFFFMIFSAMFFPFSALPDWILVISRALPTSYGVDLFRSTLMGYPSGFPELAPVTTELWIITLFGLFMPFIGFWLFNKAEARGKKKGTLGAY